MCCFPGVLSIHVPSLQPRPGAKTPPAILVTKILEVKIRIWGTLHLEELIESFLKGTRA